MAMISFRPSPFRGRVLHGGRWDGCGHRLRGDPGTVAAVMASFASHRSGTALPHLRAGTGASRPRCEPRAAVRAGPSSPLPLRSPRTRTPPACGSSGPHPCGCQSLPRRRFPGQPDAAQAQPGRTGFSAITFIGFPGRPEWADPGQRWSPYAAAPGKARARYRTARCRLH